MNSIAKESRALAAPLRVVITCLTALAIASTAVTCSSAAAELSRADYESCQARDEVGLQSALANISADALKAGTKSIDYRSLVSDQWRRVGLDEIIDKRVDFAVDEVKNETSWTERLQSLANADASQKLATSVAERVYRSDVVKVALEDLVTGVAKDVGKTIEFASTDASEPILNCLKAFVGPRYGSAISQAVAGDANKDLTFDPQKGAGEVSSGAILKQTGGGIAGATILIVRRQLATIATRVGQRIVGSVLSRLVSVAAGGVGLVLIAKDIWEFRNGVLPIIATEMKAVATKEKVREEMATTIADQIGSHIKEIGTASADHVVEIWQTFKRAHALVLKLADADEGFRKFLDGVKPAALPRLDEIVSLLAVSEGEAGIMKRLSDGSLNEAVHAMPTEGMDIVRQTKSVANGLAWTALAGDKLPSVVDLEIYRRTDPAGLTRSDLDRMLALDDQTAITRIASLPQSARAALLGLGTTELKTLAKSLSETELNTLASYLNGLQPGTRDQVLRTVAANPRTMQILARTRVRDAILASTDQSAAVDMMLKTTTGFSPHDIANDAILVWEGRINPWLIGEKHPSALAISAVLALVLLFWLRRLFRRQPPRNSAQAS